MEQIKEKNSIFVNQLLTNQALANIRKALKNPTGELAKCFFSSLIDQRIWESPNPQLCFKAVTVRCRDPQFLQERSKFLRVIAQTGFFAAHRKLLRGLLVQGCKNNDVQLVKELVDSGIMPALSDAFNLICKYGNLAMVRSALKALPAGRIDRRNTVGETALGIACCRGDRRMAKLLIEGGADISKIFGYEPLLVKKILTFLKKEGFKIPLPSNSDSLSSYVDRAIKGTLSEMELFIVKSHWETMPEAERVLVLMGEQVDNRQVKELQFLGFGNVTHLSLKGCSISSLDISKFPRLRSLQIQNCSLLTRLTLVKSQLNKL